MAIIRTVAELDEARARAMFEAHQAGEAGALAWDDPELDEAYPGLRNLFLGYAQTVRESDAAAGLHVVVGRFIVVDLVREETSLRSSVGAPE
jgi:hypothetical protein